MTQSLRIYHIFELLYWWGERRLKLFNRVLQIFLLDLNAALEAMIQKEGGGRYSCLECGKNMADKSKIKRHAENHLNMAHPCIVCQKVFKTRNALAHHYTREHPNEVISPWTM